jgi:hypothetical protein
MHGIISSSCMRASLMPNRETVDSQMVDVEALQTKLKEQGEVVRTLKAAKKVKKSLMRPLDGTSHIL